MKKKLKITGIVTLTIFLIFSIVCISWYTYIKMYGKEKVVSTTFEVGLQTTVDGNTKYFMEVNSYDNCFEVKFNYMLDENREQFYSQGLQYYSENGDVSIKQYRTYELTKSRTNVFGWETKYYDVKDIYSHSSNVSRINYMSGDDYEDALISTNPIDNQTYFKITLDKDGEDVVYLMHFKGSIPGTQDEKHKGNFWTTYYDYYTIYDVDWLAGLVFEGVSSLPYGTNSAFAFEFGDLFKYYEPDEKSESGWTEVTLDKAGLITNDVKSYYSIKVTKHEGNIQRANQSLFKCVNGSSDFNLTEVESQDYFYGRTIINVDNAEGESELSFVKLTDTQVVLKLSDSFNNAYLPYADKLELKVLINLDLLTAQGLEFVGFTADSGLSNYTVISCQTVQTVDGELVYSEVAYE